MPQPAFNKVDGNPMSTHGHPVQASKATNHIIKRPIEPPEIELISKYYRNYQNRLRGLAIMSLCLAVISTFLLSGVILVDWTISFILYFASLIIGAVSIGMSINILLVRNRISQVLRIGTIMEVKAPAFRNRLAPNAASWTVGPILIMPTQRTLLSMIQEGMQTSVLCIPRMRVALAINNVELKYGARILCPPNIETLAALEQISPQGANEKEEINKLETELDESVSSDERLIKLKILKDKGMITEEDYENKKKEILIKI